MDSIRKINHGCYYTPCDIVSLVWRCITPFLDDKTVVFDSSCGEGSFLRTDKGIRLIGNDSDACAIARAKKKCPHAFFTHHNALRVLKRDAYGIKEDEQLILIGNPPYNDATSLVRHKVKKIPCAIDDKLKARDLGISFLRSYVYLNADIVCVLHPLSYLIKKTNLNALREFKENYRLTRGIIIKSDVFADASRLSPFPILIALYVKDSKGMDEDYINEFSFEIAGGGSFNLADFEFISRTIEKYPRKKQDDGRLPLFFWTMRDINALRRNQTFVAHKSANSLAIKKELLDYYIYVDVFKRHIRHVPYYLGNCDIVIDHALFLQHRDFFIAECLHHRPMLASFVRMDKVISLFAARICLEDYFKSLLGVHYCD